MTPVQSRAEAGASGEAITLTSWPWRILQRKPNIGADQIVGRDGEFVGTAVMPGDARLIAAAPELLKAVREALEWTKDDETLSVDTLQRHLDWKDVLTARASFLRAAIDRATGAQP